MCSALNAQQGGNRKSTQRYTTSPPTIERPISVTLPTFYIYYTLSTEQKGTEVQQWRESFLYLFVLSYERERAPDGF